MQCSNFTCAHTHTDTQVAAVSGDARRALDICRRATELVVQDDNLAQSNRKGAAAVKVGTTHINRAVQEMFASPKILAIQ